MHSTTEDDELKIQEEPDLEVLRSMDAYTIAMEHRDKLLISSSYLFSNSTDKLRSKFRKSLK